MTYKLLISKPGKDALSDTNPDDYTFSSDYGTLKYYLDGNTSIQIIGDGSDKSTTTEITHSLGYMPFFLVYTYDFVNSTGYYVTPYANNTIGVIKTCESWVDSTKLYLKFRNKSPDTHTAYFYYKIFTNNLGLS